jgi:hypothetical protein
MKKIVWFKIIDKENVILDENKQTLVLSVTNRNQTGIYVCQVSDVYKNGGDNRDNQYALGFDLITAHFKNNNNKANNLFAKQFHLSYIYFNVA